MHEGHRRCPCTLQVSPYSSSSQMCDRNACCPVGKAEQGCSQPAQGFPAGRAAHPCAEQLCPSGAQVNNPTRARLGASTFFLGEYSFSK